MKSTRAFSDKQESTVAKLLSGKKVAGSGSPHFCGGDVKTKSFLIECKTTTTPKKSFSIKKDWLEKVEQERMDLQMPYSALAFQFEPDGENYFVVKDTLFKQMVEAFTND